MERAALSTPPETATEFPDLIVTSQAVGTQAQSPAIDAKTTGFANSSLFGNGSYQANTPSKSHRFLQSDPEFKRHDFQIYISNLSQRAGVPTRQIRKLVLKELADNALDEMDRVGRPGEVTIVQDDEHTYTVTDRGRGFADTPEELARRFSIDKEMTSSKQWRKPTRGCVGNGLRVIVGSVVSGGGRIIINTRNLQVTSTAVGWHNGNRRRPDSRLANRNGDHARD